MRVPVTFLPSGVSVWVQPGGTVLDASVVAEAAIPASCGGRGVCGGCGVRVVEGVLQDPEEVESSGLQRAPEGVRLACCARIDTPVTIKQIFPHDRSSSTGGIAVDSAEVVAGVDLGTTTVAAVVVDPAAGREVGRASVPNRQQSWGADVLSRLGAAIDGAGPELSRAARASVHEALTLAMGTCPARLDRIVISGNSAMASLFSGVDVSELAVAPFRAPSAALFQNTPDDWLEIEPSISVIVVPPIASFVGGDTLAGIAAVGLAGGSSQALLVDIGTNAEVALYSGGQLFVGSAAAGPAFEGAGFSCGGPAVPGAGVDVRVVGGVVEIDAIGGKPAEWLSGAGLLSAVAALRAVGHIDETGLFRTRGPLEDRFERDTRGVLGVDLGDQDRPIVLTQLDVRSLQVAKAAVRVAVEVVLETADISARDLSVVNIAGAFGAALPADALIGLGVVPSDARPRIRFCGNTSLQGAVAFACDLEALTAALELARRVAHVDLAKRATFGSALMTAMALEPYDV